MAGRGRRKEKGADFKEVSEATVVITIIINCLLAS